jgi:hypothetical protein
MARLSVGCGKKKSEKSGSDYGFQAGIMFFAFLEKEMRSALLFFSGTFPFSGTD